MTLDLLKRSEKGAALSAAEHDANFTAIEDEVNGKIGATAIASGTITPAPGALDLSGGADGDVLTQQADGSLAMEPIPAAASFVLGDATDVTITAVGDNEVLAFDNASGEWINQTAAEAGLAAAGHTHGLADITDSGTAAALDVPATGDAAADEVVLGDDSRLTDARTPTAHAASHQTGGSDELTIDTAQLAAGSLGPAAALGAVALTAIPLDQNGIGNAVTQSGALQLALSGATHVSGATFTCLLTGDGSNITVDGTTVLWAAPFTGAKAFSDQRILFVWYDGVVGHAWADISEAAAVAASGTPTAGQWFEWTDANTGKGVARPHDLENILDHSAAGDGATDDATAFNTAVTAAQSNNRRGVFLPYTGSGYAFATTINLPDGLDIVWHDQLIDLRDAVTHGELLTIGTSGVQNVGRTIIGLAPVVRQTQSDFSDETDVAIKAVNLEKSYGLWYGASNFTIGFELVALGGTSGDNHWCAWNNLNHFGTYQKCQKSVVFRASEFNFVNTNKLRGPAIAQPHLVNDASDVFGVQLIGSPSTGWGINDNLIEIDTSLNTARTGICRAFLTNDARNNEFRNRFEDGDLPVIETTTPAFDRNIVYVDRSTVFGASSPDDLVLTPTQQANGDPALSTVITPRQTIAEARRGVGSDFQVITFAAPNTSWNVDHWPHAELTLTADTTLDVSDDNVMHKFRGRFVLRVIQDGTGGHSITAGTGLSHGGTLPIHPDPTRQSLLVFQGNGAALELVTHYVDALVDRSGNLRLDSDVAGVNGDRASAVLHSQHASEVSILAEGTKSIRLGNVDTNPGVMGIFPSVTAPVLARTIGPWADNGTHRLGNAGWRWGSVNLYPHTTVEANALGASAWGAGAVIYVTDGDNGVPCLAVSNGTNWLRIPLGAAIDDNP